MKKQRSTRAALVRFAQVATASAAFALIAACGGGGDDNNSTPAGGVKLQVVSFGDSLSDVGTYAPVAAANFGGGRFTTNPGQVWVQNVAQYYGDTLTPAMTGGFGVAPTNQSGLGYAQGGARVTNPMGIGHATDPNSYAGALTVPVATQVQNYLAAHGSFNANQLVIVNGGANDVLYNLQLVKAGAISQADASTAIITAAKQLGGIVATILQHGATHVLVSNVPDIGTTPQGTMSDAVTRAGLSSASIGFNTALDQTLQALNIKSKVIYLDTPPKLAQITANYQQLGFTVSNTGTACNLKAMAAAAQKYGEPNPQDFATSLFCSPETLTVAGADQTYMYADTVHPTTHLHALYAQAAEQTIAATGLGK
ncbi:MULTISPECIES: SGNH/GDSL hydrolase family protein [Caballeronia]|jgi:phospholipase/lecithinase/hemolysin|uniref:Acylhydrolase n=1 Tax=Caballeronia zhejiangensis TaxID=871203 RepID=A0A656QQR6_9BURK|nr:MULTISPECIES: SGNH/GDSL hydrolase family protein [Caballeronia]EKS68631.1 putative acylhydrolase [Burkholderia sp. SJ98]KDR33258.1 acylhydrolase [Caballeronia zhejiangensis]MCG7399214.1 SGNH/GDSL hydrolase family protein [Caballeronia zhejiangensis]MCI1042279.1 SGNH/GDSL hydrolase family protein [Caballeronia zhejiangensis]MDR5764291.1 SGNH/GDSL hydrolase family protein [Caballeronia sp. LZ028]